MGSTSGGEIAETSKLGRGLREVVLGESELEGAVGRERSAHHAPGTVPWEAGMHGRYDSVGGVEQAIWMCSSGMKLALCQAVDVWRVQRDTLNTAPWSGTLDCLNRIADLGSFPLRQREPVDIHVGRRILAPLVGSEMKH